MVTRAFRGIPGVTVYTAERAGPTLVIVGHMHGNEPVGRRVIERFDGQPDLLMKGRVIAVLANLEAMQADVRHTSDGVDMNRLWHGEMLEALAHKDPATMCYEERRVLELAPVLMLGDVVLDMHSTSRPSATHLLFRDDLRHALLAAKLGVPRLVTGLHTGRILDGGLASDVGLRRGCMGSRLGFTLEAGQHSDHQNVEAAWSVVARLMVELEMWGGEPLASIDGQYEVFEVTDRYVQSSSRSELFRFVGYHGGELGGGRLHQSERYLESFESVEADEILLRRGSDEVVRAPAPFTMLMPAPTASPGEDLFYVAKRRHAALRDRPQTDNTARLEARAVERFVDLMSDDESHRGVTYASFTPRRTLDMCAAILGRVSRLPEGHPHRMVRVIGRGDWGGGEQEVRDGSRYQQAMQHVIEAGVPVTRYQLLRGASLGWLRNLSNIGLAGMASDARMRFFVSMRHPHTVSVLIIGDLERALREGDYHHVRVALVVEAATVESQGANAVTRIARAAIFGSRPEIVKVAHAMCETLEDEHRALLEQDAFGIGERWRSLCDETQAFSPTQREDIEFLRACLHATQMSTWRESLRHEVTQPLVLQHEEELGSWLVRVMVASGVLDPSTLKSWLVSESAEGWLVDPGRVDQVRALPDPATSSGREARSHAVLDADAVDRDNYERWVSWKRFVREAQALPGSRGRDMDLTMTGEEIRNRFARWCSDARSLAQREPGQWLFVVAGDGLSPERELGISGWSVNREHRALVLDANIHYVRIQHAEATHLSWLKGLVQTVSRRPTHGASVSIGWEAEHGASVNVVMLARRIEEEANNRTLEGWKVERCAVVLSNGYVGGLQDYQVSMSTELGEDGQVNQELLHFGRAHCEGLLKQARGWVSGQAGPSMTVRLVQSTQMLIAGWVSRIRGESRGDASRARAAVQQLGLRDAWLVERLVATASSSETPAQCARAIWDEVTVWPEVEPSWVPDASRQGRHAERPS